jgi:SAM-dependent methyltransferase
MSERVRALSFGGAAETYDRVRPAYPHRAVAWALGEDPLRVADLGAGTGLLSRTLQSCGHEVVSLDPDPAMLARLRAADPGARAVHAAAEHLPLASNTVDAVAAGQSYHWMDAERVPAEIARVLRPGGTFAALWNFLDQREPWAGALAELLGFADSGPRIEDEWIYGDVTPHLTAPERATFDHAVTMTPESFSVVLHTHSFYRVAGGPERARVDEAVHRILHGHPDLAGRPSFPVPYRTTVYRMRAGA